MSGSSARSCCAGLVLLLAGLVACSDASESDNLNRNNAVDAGDMAVDVGIDTGVEPTCDVAFAPGNAPFERLSEYCFFGGIVEAQVPNDGVFGYDVIATLYADDSKKLRYLVLPPGESIKFSEDEAWEFPVGAVIIKTFYVNHDDRDPALGRQLIETRLLVLEPNGWQPYIYLWNSEQTDASLHQIGKWIDVGWFDKDGASKTLNYRVPNKNQCKNCHGQDDLFQPLGPSTRQMNRDYVYQGERQNQLSRLADKGWFEASIASPDTLARLSDPLGDDPLERRARSYLDANCSHCHNDAGSAGPSGLKLSISIQEPREYGVCRRPVAAGGGSGGRLFDITPGESEASIMVFRMSSTDPELKMPELPTQTSDAIGVALIASWIDAMSQSTCDGL